MKKIVGNKKIFLCTYFQHSLNQIKKIELKPSNTYNFFILTMNLVSSRPVRLSRAIRPAPWTTIKPMLASCVHVSNKINYRIYGFQMDIRLTNLDLIRRESASIWIFDWIGWRNTKIFPYIFELNIHLQYYGYNSTR